MCAMLLGEESSSVEAPVAARRLLADAGRDVRNPIHEQMRRLRVPEQAVRLWLEAPHVPLQTQSLVVEQALARGIGRGKAAAGGRAKPSKPATRNKSAPGFRASPQGARE